MAANRRIELFSESKSGAFEALVNGIRSVVWNVGDVHDKRIRVDHVQPLATDSGKHRVAMSVLVEPLAGA